MACLHWRKWGSDFSSSEIKNSLCQGAKIPVSVCANSSLTALCFVRRKAWNSEVRLLSNGWLPISSLEWYYIWEIVIPHIWWWVLKWTLYLVSILDFRHLRFMPSWQIIDFVLILKFEFTTPPVQHPTMLVMWIKRQQYCFTMVLYKHWLKASNFKLWELVYTVPASCLRGEGTYIIFPTILLGFQISSL